MRKKILFVIGLLIFILQLSAQPVCNWDIIDKNGNILFEINGAEEVGSFSEGVMWVKKNGISIILDRRFNEIFRSDNYEIVQFSEMQSGRIPYFDRKKNLYGYLDKNGVPVISSRFTDVQSFSAGVAVVGVGGDLFDNLDPNKKYGLIDVLGRILLPCEYSKIIQIENDIWKGIGYRKRRYYLLSQRNKKINERILPEGISIYGGFSNYVIFKKGDLYGTMDWNGNILCSAKFKTIYHSSKTEIVSKEEGSKNSLYNVHGKLKMKGKKNIVGLLGDHYFSVENSDRNLLIVDRKFNIIVPGEYDYISYCGNGIVQLMNGQILGFYNLEKKKFITKMEYDCFFGAISDDGIFSAGKYVE